MPSAWDAINDQYSCPPYTSLHAKPLTNFSGGQPDLERGSAVGAVRGDQHVGHVPERAARWKRLCLEHVQRRAAQAPCLQRCTHAQHDQQGQNILLWLCRTLVDYFGALAGAFVVIAPS